MVPHCHAILSPSDVAKRKKVETLKMKEDHDAACKLGAALAQQRRNDVDGCYDDCFD